MDSYKTKKLIQRTKIIAMSEAGLMPTAISIKLGISRDTVYRWLMRSDREDLMDRRRGAPPRATTAEEDKNIIEIAESNPHLNAVQIQQALQLSASVDTVRERLHSNGIHHRSPAIKDFLTDKHKQSRLQFAQQYLDKDMDFWSRVIYTDEKTFSSSSHGRRHCWRRDGTRSVWLYYTIHTIFAILSTIFINYGNYDCFHLMKKNVI